MNVSVIMKTTRFLIVAGISLAIAFSCSLDMNNDWSVPVPDFCEDENGNKSIAFSCPTGNDDEFQPSSSSSSEPPPSGTVLCLLGPSCVTLNIGDCLQHGTPVDFCPSDGVSSSSSLSSSSLSSSSLSSSSVSSPGISSSSSITSPPAGSVLCILGTSCVTLNISDCLQHGTPVDFCPSDGVSSSSSLRSSSSVCADNSYRAGPSLAYEGKTYSTVKIACQTWMAENLNFNAENSRCYGDNTGGDSQNICGKYGRLYNWATAMALPSSCNSSTCSNDIQTKHRGVCPSGWHIPSNEEWDQLFHFVDGTDAGTGTDSTLTRPYDSPTVGKYLKATSGWNSGTSNGNGKDTYGFAALPGGNGKSGSNFNNVGNNGHWWSSNEGNSNNAYRMNIHYYMDYAYHSNGVKDFMFSVRCVQD